MIRTTPVEYGTQPYDWNSKYIYECSWYVYWRCCENHQPFPCWWDRATETGTFTDAKLWPENYRDPWVVKGKNYTPVAGDIVVFNGTYGHVAYIEKVEGKKALLSQYMNGDKNSFSNYSWDIGTSYTGPLMGYLHCPYSTVDPVPRNTEVDQIQTTDETLRIRLKPSLNGEIVGHVGLGYYDVYDKVQADNYTWYQIEEGRWCADVTTNYLPASGEEDIMKKIEEYFNRMKGEINVLSEQNTKYKERMEKIHRLSEAEE